MIELLYYIGHIVIFESLIEYNVLFSKQRYLSQGRSYALFVGYVFPNIIDRINKNIVLSAG